MVTSARQKICSAVWIFFETALSPRIARVTVARSEYTTPSRSLVVRGLKSLLKKTAPGKLVRTRKYTAYRSINHNGRAVGPNLRGIARLLSERTWSQGSHERVSDGRKGPAWKGPNGGQRRGKAVDAQVTRLAKMSASARQSASMMRMTKMTFVALEHHKLVPVDAQRVVVDAKRRLGTAIDIVCQRGNDELVLVELKAGYAGSRVAAAMLKGRKCQMKGPLAKAQDTVLHRHLAQLATTASLFRAEAGTMRALKTKKIAKVSAALLYVNENGSELHALPDWWTRKASKLVEFIT